MTYTVHIDMVGGLTTKICRINDDEWEDVVYRLDHSTDTEFVDFNSVLIQRDKIVRVYKESSYEKGKSENL